MNCSQNRIPVMKKLACISQMCTVWLFSARSNSAGMCQATMATLNSAMATQGRSTTPPTARTGRAQPRRMTSLVALAAQPAGQRVQQRLPGCAGHNKVGAANMSSRCWIMCTKK